MTAKSETGGAEAATIRPMEEGDLPAVAEMLARLAGHLQPGFVPLADLESVTRYGPTGLRLFDALVATRDGRYVGLCLYTYAFSSYRGRPGVFVQDLYVEPSERGSGLGRALLAAAFRREAANGCTFAKLEVHRVNASAIAFYQRLGFAFEDHDHRMVIEQGEIAALLAES
jgi:GNAT superfamily N-acetyltransferase